MHLYYQGNSELLVNHRRYYLDVDYNCTHIFQTYSYQIKLDNFAHGVQVNCFVGQINRHEETKIPRQTHTHTCIKFSVYLCLFRGIFDNQECTVSI